MNQRQAILNALSVVLVLVVNYYSQTGNINGQTVGGLSDQYANLFTPAGYAFAIWGIIFLGLIFYVIFQLIVTFKHRNQLIEYKNTGYWFMWVNIANAGWVVAWLYEYTGLSVLIMVFILLGLWRIVMKTNMERWDAPLAVIAFIWWPVCIYFGWISVATIANFAAYFSKLNWDGGPFNEVQWTIIMIIMATIINCFLIWSRNMREFALVGVWALLAIYVRHEEGNPAIAWTSLTGAVFLFISVSIHAFQNRATNPIFKMKSYFK